MGCAPLWETTCTCATSGFVTPPMTMKTIRAVMDSFEANPDTAVVRACTVCALLLPVLLWW